ncbi:unnamed protein product [Nezara viridula]|uniref:Uncharacterized protein n=1 Tax=Nezara viridula TaxID=85310 RepID=A0A9P0HTI6_NEZVI|nr:unnamed protein product [Nezara viridula]
MSREQRPTQLRTKDSWVGAILVLQLNFTLDFFQDLISLPGLSGLTFPPLLHSLSLSLLPLLPSSSNNKGSAANSRNRSQLLPSHR